MKAIGFQPSDVAEVQPAARQQQQLIDLNKHREAKLAQKWAHGLFEGDPEKVRQARAEIARWNADNPQSPITISTPQIGRLVQEMRVDRAQRLEKTAPKETRQGVREPLAEASAR